MKKNTYEFEGWYTDSNFATPFVPSNPITGNLTLYAKWSVEEQDDKTETYNVEDNKGNIITFREIPDREYELTIIDYLSYTKEQVMELSGITSKQYDEVIGGIKEIAKKEGTLISIYKTTKVSSIPIGLIYVKSI